jgi:hypothetical protein
MRKPHLNIGDDVSGTYRMERVRHPHPSLRTLPITSS